MQYIEMLPFLALYGILLPIYVHWGKTVEAELHYHNLYDREREEREAVLELWRENSAYLNAKIEALQQQLANQNSSG